MTTFSISNISQVNTLDMQKVASNDTIKLNGQNYNITIIDDKISVKAQTLKTNAGKIDFGAQVKKDLGQFFDRVSVSPRAPRGDKVALAPTYGQQMTNALQEKLNVQHNQNMDIANINSGTAFFDALEQYKGTMTKNDAIAFKQAYRNIQLNNKGSQEIYGAALIAKSFNHGITSEAQYQRLCDLTQIAAKHGVLSNQITNSNQLSQTDFIGLQEFAADSRAIQIVAQQTGQNANTLYSQIQGHTAKEQMQFDKTETGKMIIAESQQIKKENSKICAELSWQALEKR
ncbi:hypothetical protein [uncultured Shewanella sp.]|uniref:hypothetical protein n=1 Tax=uncultured Shewanella sp. TaxID=173975 RepID=UPI00260D447D|nr:hypothetical protein [uncultured Shewanella sp.]